MKHQTSTAIAIVAEQHFSYICQVCSPVKNTKPEDFKQNCGTLGRVIAYEGEQATNKLSKGRSLRCLRCCESSTCWLLLTLSNSLKR